AKLIVWSNGSAEVFKKAKINVQGKSITHIYRPQYSIDGITWYYYYYADVYTESERLGDKRGLPGAFLAGSLLDEPLYLCKFDGQQMHSKNCLGFVTDKGVASESRCKGDIPLHFRYLSGSDSFYKPRQEFEIRIPCIPNKPVYNRLQILSFDAADSINTICTTYTKKTHVRTYPNFSDLSRGDLKVDTFHYISPQDILQNNLDPDSSYLVFTHRVS